MHMTPITIENFACGNEDIFELSKEQV